MDYLKLNTRDFLNEVYESNVETSDMVKYVRINSGGDLMYLDRLRGDADTLAVCYTHQHNDAEYNAADKQLKEEIAQGIEPTIKYTKEIPEEAEPEFSKELEEYKESEEWRGFSSHEKCFAIRKLTEKYIKKYDSYTASPRVEYSRNRGVDELRVFIRIVDDIIEEESIKQKTANKIIDDYLIDIRRRLLDRDKTTIPRFIPFDNGTIRDKLIGMTNEERDAFFRMAAYDIVRHSEGVEFNLRSRGIITDDDIDEYEIDERRMTGGFDVLSVEYKKDDGKKSLFVLGGKGSAYSDMMFFIIIKIKEIASAFGLNVSKYIEEEVSKTKVESWPEWIYASSVDYFNKDSNAEERYNIIKKKKTRFKSILSQEQMMTLLRLMKDRGLFEPDDTKLGEIGAALCGGSKDKARQIVTGVNKEHINMTLRSKKQATQIQDILHDIIDQIEIEKKEI